MLAQVRGESLEGKWYRDTFDIVCAHQFELKAHETVLSSAAGNAAALKGLHANNTCHSCTICPSELLICP